MTSDRPDASAIGYTGWNSGEEEEAALLTFRQPRADFDPAHGASSHRPWPRPTQQLDQCFEPARPDTASVDQWLDYPAQHMGLVKPGIGAFACVALCHQMAIRPVHQAVCDQRRVVAREDDQAPQRQLTG